MDIQVAEVKIPRHSSARARAKRCSRCGSPASLGAYRSEGIPLANSSSLCLQCTELRSELEALSEEYRSCLTRLRQCRDELNHFQSKQAKVGGIPHPTPSAFGPRLQIGLGKIPPSICAVQKDE